MANTSEWGPQRHNFTEEMCIRDSLREDIGRERGRLRELLLSACLLYTSRLGTATDEKSKNYYRSVILSLEGALAFIARYEELVRQTLSHTEEESRRAELSEMAEGLAQLQVGAPKTYLQATQLMYFIQFLIWTEGGYLIPLGRTDQILYPFYDRDISAGRLTPERALEIMECFFIKLNYEIDRTHGEAGKFESDTGQSITCLLYTSST